MLVIKGMAGRDSAVAAPAPERAPQCSSLKARRKAPPSLDKTGAYGFFRPHPGARARFIRIGRRQPSRSRTVPCTAIVLIHAADLRLADVGADVRLSGWCHRIRDHGGLLFIDLRDHYGLTQCVVDPGFARLSRSPRRCAPNGSSASTARCAARPAGTENADLPTGEIEVYAAEIEVLSAGRRSCRCRSSATRNIRRTRGSSTASWICGARRCTTTS